MLNPWLSFSLQAVRLGWRTQSLVVDQMVQLAGVGISDRTAAEQNAMAVPTVDGDAPELPTSRVTAAVPARSSKHRHVVQKVTKIHKKQSLRNKRRRSH
jgi:hypothetical protein